jgi:pSer/pThr/pTyr-binding forkhead associated (FHA) protein
MQIKLVVVEGAASRGEVQLRLPAVIGRSKDANLTIGHPKVSRRHCELYEVGGRVMVRDHGSLNGTLLDGNRITQATVPPGGKLTIGPLTFIALFESPSAAKEPSVPVIAAGENGEQQVLPDNIPGPDTDAAGFDLGEDEDEPAPRGATLNPTLDWKQPVESAANVESAADAAARKPGNSAFDVDEHDLGALGDEAEAKPSHGSPLAAQARKSAETAPQSQAQKEESKDLAEPEKDDDALSAFLRDLGR